MEASYSGAKESLLHDTVINKQKLMDAIRIGDFKTAKQLIEVGMDMNFIFGRFTPLSPLHATLALRSMDMLEILLSLPNIDLNISNEGLAAPLLWSFKSYYSKCFTGPLPEEFILRLIRAGCDINRSNGYGKTALHLSVKYGMRRSTHELLKQNADVNVQNFRTDDTPLHYAVTKNNLELVCMLLNYNADVFIKNKKGHTPFSYALHLEYHEIAEVLSNYYSFLDDDVNYIIDNDDVCKVFLKYTNAELFKAVWPRFDPELILSKCKLLHNCFINCYIHWCRYSTSDWVECLYLILNSNIAFDLIHCNCFTFCELLNCMRKRHVQSDDTIGLIYMVLRLGFEVQISDINYAVAFYGLSRELEPFIYGSYNRSVIDGCRFVCPLHAFVIGLETDFSVKKISQLFHDALKEWDYNLCYGLECVLAETFAKTVPFFSFPADAKNRVTRLIKDLRYHVIMDDKQLQEIPEFPSLMELSRNQIYKYLVQTFRFKQPYQLQDCVKKLPIPNRIKDIILFKEPIY